MPDLLFPAIACALAGSSIFLLLRSEKYKREVVFLRKELALVEKTEAEIRERLGETFQALSRKALAENSDLLLTLAKEKFAVFEERARGDLEKKRDAFSTLVTPIKETLSDLDRKMSDMEKERRGDRDSLRTQINAVVTSERELCKQTATLARAFDNPTMRGRWGEVQLRRIVELAGMIEHCDFYEQKGIEGESRMRPDLIVRLPGKKYVVVDAKTPAKAFLEATELDDEEAKKVKFTEHARQLRQHVKSLGRKRDRYQQGDDEENVDFVVLFLPSDQFFSVALRHDPSLIECGPENGVVVATPTTLIALLRVVAVAWRREKFSLNAKEVSKVGRELCERIAKVNEHLARVGRGLMQAVDAYNKTINSFEKRVTPSAEKLRRLGAAPESITVETPPPVERMPTNH